MALQAVRGVLSVLSSSPTLNMGQIGPLCTSCTSITSTVKGFQGASILRTDYLSGGVPNLIYYPHAVYLLTMACCLLAGRYRHTPINDG